MFFQKVVKGISGLDAAEATWIVRHSGISCNWWRLVGEISAPEIKQRMTEANLINHLNRYSDPLPASHPLRSTTNAATFGEVTPFISTSAGAIQRDEFGSRNILFPPLITALQFATDNFKGVGFVFYAYVTTLGKKAIPLRQMAEEVRELHIYRQFLPYHHEGEIVAKISIPSSQIEKAEEYDGAIALTQLSQGLIPTPLHPPILNRDYADPSNYSNVRELL